MNVTMKLAAIATTVILGTNATGSAADRYTNQKTAFGCLTPVYRAARYCPPTSINYHVNYQQPAPVVYPPRQCAPVRPCPPPPCNQCNTYPGGVNRYPTYNYGPVNYGTPAPYQPNPYPYAPYGQNNNAPQNKSNVRGIADRTDPYNRQSVTTARPSENANPRLR
ncbi:hypothetical protein [Thalassoroseus pseudoceratinae]|uniref:hypothetical protein n=1 Tax=Thalassoroseus pseudoceratinae TaxID=2713176 RepID=UPI0014224B95|nr:hypothetical protein [Thalassoroseus pseudoceratinae]